jgi:predicted patatin/cPLA2 family phospholipase
MIDYNLPNDIGLVLEGGGFRGMYTAGVLDAFLQQELYFKYVIGVSAGADYGASYVSRQFGRNLAVNEYVSDPNYCSWFHLLSKGEYFNDHFVYHYLPEHLVPFDFEAFTKSGVTMKVGLTDCNTGKADFKTLDATDKERFATLLSATSSLPVIARPKRIDNEFYMDGGISDSIPVQQAFNDGHKRLVVILTRDVAYRKDQVKFLPFWKRHYRYYPRLAEAIINRAAQYNQTLDMIAKLEKEGSIYVIRPNEMLPVSRMENKPKRLEKVYYMGLEQMNKDVDRLKEWIGI